MLRRTRLPPRSARDGETVPRLRRRLDAVTEAALIAELTRARTALVQAAARVQSIQQAGLQHWDPWIHSGRITAAVRRSLLIGPAGPCRLRGRLRAWHDGMGCPREPRLQPRNAVAALAADFAALPLRATWLIRQLDRVVDEPGLATARVAGERWLRVRNALVETLQGFLVTLARRVPAWHVPIEDRIQAGTLAVVVAIERFDPTRGTRLTTYLGPVLERAVRRLGRRTPRSAVTGSPGFVTVGRAMPLAPPIHVGWLRANGREPGRYALTLVTLDGHEDDGPGPLVERLADPAATPEELAVLAIDATRAQAHLARLGPREQVVLQLLFGLDGIEALDHRRVATIVGVSAATVRRVRDRALAQLARGLRAPHASTPSISIPFGEVSSCLTCWPPASCSSSMSPSGPGAPRSAPPTSVSIRRASPRTTPSGGSGSSRNRPSIRWRRSSVRRATRSRA
jgi:RNA polymerase primary sigma factor